MSQKIEYLSDPTPTIGDDLPYYSCRYEEVPDEFRLANLIKPEVTFPKTKEIIDRLVRVADMEFKGWEIIGPTLVDFGDNVRLQYLKNADKLERYISTIEQVKIDLVNKTKMTVGAGEVTLKIDSKDTTNNNNLQTVDTQDSNVGLDITKNNINNTTDVNLDSKTTTKGNGGSGPVAFGTDEKMNDSITNVSKIDNTVTVSGKPQTKLTGFNDSTVTRSNDLFRTGTVDNTLNGTVTIDGKNVTTTKERTTSTESSTPGVAMAELAKIPGILSVEDYFINIFKPCFTLYRWLHW